MPDDATCPCRIITFYSYKGGTGRSMGVANVAWVLALSGFKVLVIDWDLEAPGLHRYFRPFLNDPDASASDGLIDFVTHFVEAASEQPESVPEDWYKPYSNLLHYAQQLNYDFPGAGTVDFIPAGRQNSAYSVRVNSFNWKHFYEKLNGGKVLEEARNIMRAEYDYVLIDSRTGVSDTAGICTVEMPDDLVVCFTLNLQSVIGAASTAASVKEQRELRGQPIRVFPVPMRVEVGEKTKTSIMKEFAKPKFLPLLPAAMTEEQKDKYWGESDVPYIPFYAFEENLAYFRDDRNSINSVLAAMKLIARRLTSAEIPDLPKLDPQVQTQIVAEYDAFSMTKIAGAAPERPKTAVYISSDSDDAVAALRSALQASGWEALVRERGGDAADRRESLRRLVRRASLYLVAVVEKGLTVQQREELFAAERARGLPDGSRLAIWTVLLPGAVPESLPRLLLPYGVIDLRSGGDPAARVAALLASADKQPSERLPLSPYPGLRPFTVDDSPMFSGRDALVDRLAGAVAKSSLVTLIGPPRSGKTSLVEAGLVPRLKQGSTDTAWDVRLDFPATSTILAAQRDPDGPAPRVLLVSTAVAFAAYIERGDAAIQPTPAGWSLTASGDPMASVLILAETEEQVLACERVARANATRVEMTALSEQELAAAVTEPAFGAGLTVESGLAKRIAADVKNVRQPLPLLQYALTQLWAREPRGILTMQKYEAMGGVHVAERLCAAVFASLSAEDQTRCLRALTRLIFVPQTGPAIPQPAPEASIPGADRVALDAFLSAGILVRGREENSQAVWLRFADAIFLDGFPRVQAQVDEKRDFLLWRQRLARNLSAWQANRRSFTLLSGAQLAEAVRQAAAHSEELNEQERAYIAESSAAAEAVVEQRSSSQLRQKRTSYGWAVAGALTLLVSGMYFYNSHQKNALFENLVSAGARLASSGDFQGALEQYQKASAIRPSDAQVATATGTLYASLGRPKDALQAFDKAINHAPTDIDALPRRGDVNAQLGLIQAALDDWLKTLTVSPGDQRTKLDLGQILDKKPGQTTVIFYDQGVADAALRNELAGKLQQAGFQVQQRPYGIAQPPNVVWYAADVPAERWQTVARLLLESKVVLRQTKQQPDLGSLNIQIGYSAEAANQPPLTMKDL